MYWFFPFFLVGGGGGVKTLSTFDFIMRNWPSNKKLFGFFPKNKIKYVHGLGPIEMGPNNSNVFLIQTPNVCHSSYKIGTKRSQK